MESWQWQGWDAATGEEDDLRMRWENFPWWRPGSGRDGMAARRRWVSLEEARCLRVGFPTLLTWWSTSGPSVEWQRGAAVQDNCGVGLRACGGWASLPAATTTRLLIPCWLHSADWRLGSLTKLELEEEKKKIVLVMSKKSGSIYVM